MSASGHMHSVLVHGATGLTGRLVCEALHRRGIRFAVSGRNREKVEALAASFGPHANGPTSNRPALSPQSPQTHPVEAVVLDAKVAETVAPALEGRTLVCACAGPFLELGEPVLASCARKGIHYIDTTGEQAFVHAMRARYQATAEASGACIVPAMAYEIALADWACNLAAERLGGTADSIDVVYILGGKAGPAVSRGTQLSALGMLAQPNSFQFVEGLLVQEPLGTRIRTFRRSDGSTVEAVSFPSVEQIVVPAHTRAKNITTYIALGSHTTGWIHRMRSVLPWVARAGRPIAQRFSPKPLDSVSRAASSFEVVCEARMGSLTETVRVTGRDPYGITAEIQACAAAHVLTNGLKTRGIVAPSQAFSAREALYELAPFGVRVS